jgi:hypothetical protein
MPSSAISYQSSDAWLLYSVIHASKNAPASLAKVIEVGDYYNHAVFTDEELHGGLNRLVPGGWVIREKSLFQASALALQTYGDIQKRKLSCFEEMAELKRVLFPS